MSMSVPINEVHYSTLEAAEKVSEFLWPDFVVEHGMVLLARHAGSNPCPSGTLSDWESFINHTHVFDEFGSDSEAVHFRTALKDWFDILQSICTICALLAGAYWFIAQESLTPEIKLEHTVSV
jgi:hypothetical protein